MRRSTPILLACSLLLASLAVTAQFVTAAPASAVSPAVRMQLNAAAPTQMITVIVSMNDRVDFGGSRTGPFADRLHGVVSDLRTKQSVSQFLILAYLSLLRALGQVGSFTPLWVNNSVSVTATPSVIAALGRRPDVSLITPDQVPIVKVGARVAAATSSDVSRTLANSVWDLGYTGQGVVVADLDSGVDAAHPDLAASYRGGSNSWFDPYGQHATPTDLDGHGTATTGVMVAGSSTGSTIGMAPGAQWIAARVFNDAGTATATAIHLSLQWVLDPDNNPDTADAPRVVNNSWSYGSIGCNLEFQPDVQALRAAGIMPVFAAGNFGPGVGTSVSPANYPESIAVGVTNNRDVVNSMSSRGASTCGGRTGVFPDLVAPGVSVITTDLYGSYYPYTGTSLSAPKVSGALALLASYQPDPSADIKGALVHGAVDLGASGADDVYGNGRINVLAAAQWLDANPPGSTTTTTTLPPTTTTTTLPGPADLVFADGFEGGSVSAWSGVANPSGLSVATAAAQSGSFGLRALVSGTADTYVLDTSPMALASYNARFRFAPNGVTLPTNRTQELIEVLDGGGNVVGRVELRKTTTSYQVRAVARNGTSTKASTWTNISNASHTLEIGWTSATSSTAKNGTLSFWIDGAANATLTSLVTGTSRVEEARLGPQMIGSGIAGTEYFDAFSSTRGSYIGV